MKSSAILLCAESALDRRRGVVAFRQWQEARGEKGKVREGGLASGDAGRVGGELFDEGFAAAHGS